MQLTIERMAPKSLIALLTTAVFILAALIQGQLSVTGSGYGCGTYTGTYEGVYPGGGTYIGTYTGTYSGIYDTCPPPSAGEPTPTPVPPVVVVPPVVTTPEPDPEPTETTSQTFTTSVPTQEALVLTAGGGKIELTVPPGFVNVGADADVEITVDTVTDEAKVSQLAAKAQALFTPAETTASVTSRSIAPPFVLNVATAGTTVKKFEEPIKVRMEIPAEVNSRQVKVFWIDDDGDVHPVKTKPGSVIFSAPGSGTYVFMEIDRTFSDTAGHWAQGDLRIAASQLIVDGYPDGTFKPEGTVTRAEFVAMLVRSLDLPAATSAATFTDVPAGAWYSAALATAVSNGLIKGIGDGKFDPNGLITREQMMAILGRAAVAVKLPQTGFDLSVYADRGQISDWAASDVAAAVRSGLVQGVREGLVFRLLPGDQTTRAQAAVTMLRMYDKAD
jgi:hypothetical protein